MSTSNERVLKRDCEATVIPSGDKVHVPKNTRVIITHRLGGNFTITCDWGLFRIAGKDADALGEKIPDEISQQTPKIPTSEGPPDESAIWDQLKSVYDPEIPVNIVDLGLVYSMDLKEEPKGHFTAHVSMTLTSPGCGMGPAIAEDAKTRIMTVPGVGGAEVEIVWDPAWNQSMISEEGKMQLGLI